MIPNHERLFSPEQVSEILEISADTIRDWLRRGELRAIKLKKHWKIRESDLQAFLEAHTTQGPDLPTNGHDDECTALPESPAVEPTHQANGEVTRPEEPS